MSQLDPAVAAGRLAVRRWLKALPPSRSRSDAASADVLVACSGGPDSLALAAVVAFEARADGIRAGAALVDHGLLPSSSEQTAEAAAVCRSLGLDPVVVLPVTVDRSSGTGLEAAARSARYAALERIAEQAGTSLVLLGHTLDDQAESVLLALARGAGGTALSGMAARRGIFGRPFLDIKRAQTLAICAAEGLTPYSDPTNQVGGPYFSLRSELRGRLIPVLAEVLGPAAIGALARSATRIRQDQECLRQQAAELFNRAVIGQVGPQDDLRLCLDATVLAKAHPALISRALHQAALAAGARPASVNRAQVAAIEALVVDWHGQGPVALPGRIEVRRKCGKLEFHS